MKSTKPAVSSAKKSMTLSSKQIDIPTQAASDIYTETSKKIQDGLEKDTASTGTPMKALKGGAKFMASLSNIGGGSVETGGGGVHDGFNTIMLNKMAESVLRSVLSPHRTLDDHSKHEEQPQHSTPQMHSLH